MLNLTIGQISTATSLQGTTYLEAEIDGVSKKTTLQLLANYAIPCGAYVDMAYEKTPSATFPAVPIYDADHTVSATNYPILVDELRAAVTSITLTAGTVVTSINVNATGGSVLSSVDSAFTIITAAIVEEYAVQGTYDIAVTIGGTDYTITSASSTLKISGTIATGATTMSVYPHRIVGSTTTAKVFKGSGRALLNHDGKTYLGGFRRRDRLQGHYHNNKSTYGGATGGFGRLMDVSPSSSDDADIVKYVKSDGVNGTPRTGPTTDPNSTVSFRYLWAQEYIA